MASDCWGTASGCWSTCPSVSQLGYATVVLLMEEYSFGMWQFVYVKFGVITVIYICYCMHLKAGRLWNLPGWQCAVELSTLRCACEWGRK